MYRYNGGTFPCIKPTLFSARVPVSAGSAAPPTRCSPPRSATARNAVQGALLRAWDRRETLRQEAYFDTWLIRMLIFRGKQSNTAIPGASCAPAAVNGHRTRARKTAPDAPSLWIRRKRQQDLRLPERLGRRPSSARHKAPPSRFRPSSPRNMPHLTAL